MNRGRAGVVFVLLGLGCGPSGGTAGTSGTGGTAGTGGTSGTGGAAGAGGAAGTGGAAGAGGTAGVAGTSGAAGTNSVAGAGGSAGGAGAGGASSGSAGTGGAAPGACNGLCTDFPGQPLIDDGAPADAPQIFAATGNAADGPCLMEPQNGALYPNNWLRPQFRFTAPAGQDLFELRVHGDNQANDLVVYTARTSWLMPLTMWRALALHTRDAPIRVSIRGISRTTGPPSAGSSTTFTIAPVGVSGNIVYWSSTGSSVFFGQPTGDETVLTRLSPDDESVTELLRPAQVATRTKDQGLNTRPVKCVGCHTATPDGLFLAFNDFYPWGVAIGSSGVADVGSAPAFLQAGGLNAVTLPWVGMSAFSGAHWVAGDRIMVAPLDTCGGASCAQGAGNDLAQQPGLAWFDLESTAAGVAPAQLSGAAWGWIHRPAAGSGQYVVAPAWTNDGTRIVFTMASSVVSGRLGTGTAHLYEIAYTKTTGTPAALPSPLAGAGSDAARAQYYPALSPDDRLIAYNEVPATVAAAKQPSPDSTLGTMIDGTWAQPQTEIFVIPSRGGTKIRLTANDPPSCPGAPISPGVNNNWARWAPEASSVGGRRYYWLAFSSWRQGMKYPTGLPISQIHLAAVVASETGTITTPAIHVWNQPALRSNHTPTWSR